MSKQVVIQGREDDWYEKAIFLLRQEPPKGRMNLVSEANQIIGTYMKTKPTEEVPRSSKESILTPKRIDFFFYGSLMLLVITFVIYLI